MSSISKPPIRHPSARKNAIGLTKADYEGGMSTLCAGCGHDSVTAALIQSFWELDLPPHRAAKMSGIGCSSKTPAYFMRQSHGFNSVHGRMPSVTTGANAANRDITYIGISGDGDSLNIGLGQMVHAIRRNVNMLYVIENNGVYGLTKGQFSATADIGSRSRKGEVTEQAAIDPVLLALTLGATFVARSFSGDKAQLVPILKAGLTHRGFALVDVISPCVSFNDHEGSTKSYAWVRGHGVETVATDFVPLRRSITVPKQREEVTVVQMHDGSRVQLRATEPGYDPVDREAAYRFARSCHDRGELATGLLFINKAGQSLHDMNRTVMTPLTQLPFDVLCPGKAALETLMERYR